jgi:hypothetical protein
VFLQAEGGHHVEIRTYEVGGELPDKVQALNGSSSEID